MVDNSTTFSDKEKLKIKNLILEYVLKGINVAA
jgi:hypothetical protein